MYNLQVRFLQTQAKDILVEAKINSQLHHAACNFKKIPGNTYYLYKRQTGQTYFSMLSPKVSFIQFAFIEISIKIFFRNGQTTPMCLSVVTD